MSTGRKEKAESSNVGRQGSGPVKEHWKDTQDFKQGKHVYMGS